MDDHPHYSEVNKATEHRDRLSELPDSLILLILSLLQMRDVVRTTILSKFWRNRWTRVPCLHFWYHSYDLLQYRDFIDGALAQWEAPKILKFTITFSSSYPGGNNLHSWLLLAIEKQVEELSLFIGEFLEVDSDYSPPQRLYSCSSITKLSLSYVKLVVEENVQWDQLKSLKIVCGNSLSADTMNRILCGAPCLEELVLFIEKISENFNIRSTSLKTLYLSSEAYFPHSTNVCAGSELRIWALNLSSLEIHARLHGSCFLYVPSLIKAVLYFVECLYERESVSLSRIIEMLDQVFQSVCHVENLTLSPWCNKFLVYMKKRKKDMAVQFSNAKFLYMRDDGELAREMLDVEMFPTLTILTVKSLFAEEGYLLTSKMTPSRCHLKTIEISVCVSYISIFGVIEVLLKNAHALEKMLLRLRVLDVPHGVDRRARIKEYEKKFDLAEEKVMSMLRSSSSTAEVIVIRQL